MNQKKNIDEVKKNLNDAGNNLMKFGCAIFILIVLILIFISFF